MNKKFINTAVIVAFIIGVILGFVYGEINNSTATITVEGEFVLYTDKLKGKYIHCDYCKGYKYSEYSLEISIPSIWVFGTEDSDRIVCNKCLSKACIKGLDKILGKPKYLKKRPKTLQRD